MKIKEIMNSSVVSAQPETTVLEAAKQMHSHDIGALPVIARTGELVGIVTDRDIVIRGVAGGACMSTAVEAVMTRDVVCASPEEEASSVLRHMAERRVRRMPVAENGKVVGMVSLGDFARLSATDTSAGFALGKITG